MDTELLLAKDNCRILSSGNVLIFEFDAPPTLSDLVWCFEQLSKTLEGIHDRLWDLGVGVSFDAEEIKGLAQQSRGYEQPAARSAIVAPENVAYGLSRMFASYRDDNRVAQGIFRTREEALAWLADSE